MCDNFEPITIIQAPIIFANIGEPAEWRSALFGMIPKWAKDTSIAKHTYNARSQTVMDKVSFKRAWYNNQFALIPVQTIFEPKYIDGKAYHYGIEREVP